MARKKLTVADVKREISHIKRAVNGLDYEAAHVLEDKLHQEVLRSIANGKVVDSKACAKAALSTLRLRFSRHCS